MRSWNLDEFGDAGMSHVPFQRTCIFWQEVTFPSLNSILLVYHGNFLYYIGLHTEIYHSNVLLAAIHLHIAVA